MRESTVDQKVAVWNLLGNKIVAAAERGTNARVKISRTFELPISAKRRVTEQVERLQNTEFAVPDLPDLPIEARLISARRVVHARRIPLPSRSADGLDLTEHEAFDVDLIVEPDCACCSTSTEAENATVR